MKGTLAMVGSSAQMGFVSTHLKRTTPGVRLFVKRRKEEPQNPIEIGVTGMLLISKKNLLSARISHGMK